MGTAKSSLYLLFGKRMLDASVATLALVIASPVLFLCTVAIWLESPGPALYRQWRIGQHNKPFQIIKLRTMIQGADKLGLRLTAAGDARITKVGKFLRRAKLDEVPQLMNVLGGEMSLVGPRPELPEYASKYAPEETMVLEVKPGITGPASLAYIDEEQMLAGRTDREDFYIKTIMREKLQLDLAYCRKVSLLKDLKIIFMTVTRLLTQRFIPTQTVIRALFKQRLPFKSGSDDPPQGASR
jgi:lipopolysaccharide/colanic/teichoic acid biosynthesis glycosyltransferase